MLVQPFFHTLHCVFLHFPGDFWSKEIPSPAGEIDVNLISRIFGKWEISEEKEMCSCTPGFVLMAHSLFPFVLVSINACTVEITPWHCHNMHENQMRLASATNLLYQWIYDSSKNALSCFYLLKSFQTFQVLVVVDGMPSKSIFITKCFQNKEALGRDNKTLRW